MMDVDLDRGMKCMCGIGRRGNLLHRWFFVDEDPLSEKRVDDDLECDRNVTLTWKVGRLLLDRDTSLVDLRPGRRA